MRQRWEDVAFVHWPVPATLATSVLPRSLAPDCHAGSAWISLVAFQMRALRIRHLPPIPTASDFAEVNDRTYVIGPDGPGVWFCSLDAQSLLPVVAARMLYGLPYCVADIRRHPGRDKDAWAITRRWPGPAAGRLDIERLDTAADDDLAVFLTARWRLYSGKRTTRVALIDHGPWPLRHARVVGCDAGLVEAAGLTVDCAPLAHWAPSVSVRVAAAKRVRSTTSLHSGR